jgi:hypothetical protein
MHRQCPAVSSSIEYRTSSHAGHCDVQQHKPRLDTTGQLTLTFVHDAEHADSASSSPERPLLSTL